jgi:hypothetical protein
MAQHAHKIGILFELGEVQRSRTNWPDCKQYGFGEEDVKDLLELVTDLSLHGAPTESKEVWVPLHAWRALAQLGDPRAIEPLIGLFDTLCEDDWALEELPIVLGMLGKKAIGPLSAFLGDSSHSHFARSMAVSGLEEIAKRDVSTRNDVVNIITEYLDDPDANASGLNGSAVNLLLSLEARESINTLRRLYESGNVDLFACGDIEDVEMELGLRSARTTARPSLGQLYGLTTSAAPKQNEVGRNDPCPCGSGRKYKKCCLQ